MNSQGKTGGTRFASADAAELIRKGAGNLVVRGLVTALALASHLVISRLWGAASLGLYTLAVTLAYSTALFSRAGTDGAAIRFVAEGSPADATTVFRRVLTITLPLSAALAIAIWAAAPALAAEVFDKRELLGPFRALAAALPLLTLLYAANACFQGRRRVVLSATLEGALPPALTLALLAAAAWRGAFAPEVPAYARAWAIAVAGATAALLWQLLAPRGARDPGAPSPPSVERLMRTAAPMFASSVLYMVLTTTDTFVLGIYRTSAEVGLYRAATSIAAAISFAPSALHTIAAPMFAGAYWRRQPERLEHLVAVTARAAFGASCLVALLLLAFAVPVLRLFGEAFVAAAPALVVYGTGLLAAAALGPVAPVLNMIGEERALYRILLAVVAVNLALNLVLVPRWGIVGAAAATAAGTVLWTGLAAARARRKLGHPVGIQLRRRRYPPPR